MEMTHLTLMLVTAAATVFLFSAAILWRGGWTRSEETTSPTRLQKSISMSFALSGINILLYAIHGKLSGTQDPWIDYLDWMSCLPLAFIYFQSYHVIQQKTTWKHFAIAFCPLIAGLLLVIVFAGQDRLVLRIVAACQFTYLFILYLTAMGKLRRWDRQMLNEFSDIAHKQTVWFRKLTLPFMLLILLWIPMTVFPDAFWIMDLYYVAEIILTLTISEHALKQEEFDFSESEKTEQETENATAVPDNGNDRQPYWVERLERLMQEEKIYCNPELSVSMLAQEIGINRTYLSRYINTTTDGTFYDYVNSYRLKEAEKYLVETNLPISAIAEMSGFASLATFSRYFRSAHNQTPTDYRFQHKA